MLGAADFVPKPFTAQQLHRAVGLQLSAERTSVLIVGGEHASFTVR